MLLFLTADYTDSTDVMDRRTPRKRRLSRPQAVCFLGYLMFKFSRLLPTVRCQILDSICSIDR